ncbi:hypothetical protein APY04_0809 [Hyphomicrobium sulfonivorans]|uniref:Uncharacterized protein n=1 Tax=Hyphomicrobium sulfonivorans TaxID=121290 RepID=A0A109BKY1_HYPSL|nr:DUF1456 family protein [Hyphomicrobium sulfonivorans]KWT70748.1 hypothetical protein APY04_0809 [Hyphomicrobium sulfonivorans]
MPTYNMWFKRIRLSHAMSRRDVVEAMRLGGVEVSSSRADRWTRADGDSRRGATMTEDEFDAFTRGLVEWTKEAQ